MKRERRGGSGKLVGDRCVHVTDCTDGPKCVLISKRTKLSTLNMFSFCMSKSLCAKKRSNKISAKIKFTIAILLHLLTQKIIGCLR